MCKITVLTFVLCIRIKSKEQIYDVMFFLLLFLTWSKRLILSDHGRFSSYHDVNALLRFSPFMRCQEREGRQCCCRRRFFTHTRCVTRKKDRKKRMMLLVMRPKRRSRVVIFYKKLSAGRNTRSCFCVDLF